jgi:hypothetical protein
LACILRCADACAIDETRAPSFLYAIRKPYGHSKRHWTFQNKIYPAKCRDDSLVFESKSAFSNGEAEDWWLCFDAIEVADRELKGADALITDRKRQPLIVRRIVGAGDPDILSQSVRVSGWRPVNTLPKISDPSGIIERLGGKQLYGDDPIVPIRELIQNAVDAIRARRFVDHRFALGSGEKYPGKVTVEFKEFPGTNEISIAVEDNGVGMSEKTITRSLLDFGTSFWSSAAAAQLYPGLPSEKKFRPTGRFGIGFFSVFMYADIVTVMSREFASATNVWNVLSFIHGVRGRGNLSVEGAPAQILSSDASSRIELRVQRDFIDSLAENVELYGRRDDQTPYETIRKLLATLVCALDVQVDLRYFDERPDCLNEPLIYERDADAIWRMVFPFSMQGLSESFLEKQKSLLSPIEERGELYGFCGVNLLQYRSLGLVRSVGGMGWREHSYETSNIVGIAEYGTAAANRAPDKLMAPQSAIDAWAKDQMVRIKQLQLTEDEQEAAGEHLGRLVDDVRPIFIAITSEGPLGLDELVDKLKAEGRAIVPVSGVQDETSAVFYGALPNISHEISLGMGDIAFSNFTIRMWDGTLKCALTDGMLKPNKREAVYKSGWDTILNTLEDRKIDFSLSHFPDFEVGTYIGLGSQRHDLHCGQQLKSPVLEIRLK